MRSMEDPVKFRELFAELDEDGDGLIEEDEWRHFITKLAHERIRYLKCKGLTTGRCFWGRGYKQDYYYHLCGNHPLLQFFLQIRTIRVRRVSSCLKELVVLKLHGLCGGGVLRADEKGDRWHARAATPRGVPQGAVIEYGITVGVVTVPCLILNQMMFHLFVCPCYVFENQRDPMEERWHKVVKCGSSTRRPTNHRGVLHTGERRGGPDADGVLLIG